MPAAQVRRTLSRTFLRFCNVVYRATGGALGANYFGQPILLLSTVGRRTGKLRVNGLVFLRDDGAGTGAATDPATDPSGDPQAERYVVVASDNGARRDPGWYHNLLATGGGTVRHRREVFRVTAAEADEHERARLWPLLLQVYGGYDAHAARAGRRLPVLVLTRVDGPALGTLS